MFLGSFIFRLTPQSQQLRQTLECFVAMTHRKKLPCRGPLGVFSFFLKINALIPLFAKLHLVQYRFALCRCGKPWKLALEYSTMIATFPMQILDHFVMSGFNSVQREGWLGVDVGKPWKLAFWILVRISTSDSDTKYTTTLGTAEAF